MATRSTPDPRSIAKLLAALRAQNVRKFRAGDLEVEFGPPPRPPEQAAERPPTAAEVKARVRHRGYDDFIQSRYNAAPKGRN